MIFSFFSNPQYFGVNSRRGRLLDRGRLLEGVSNTILTALRGAFSRTEVLEVGVYRLIYGI